jgi:hypothetical protein
MSSKNPVTRRLAEYGVDTQSNGNLHDRANAESLLDQLDRCQTPAARRLILGKGEIVTTTSYGQWKYSPASRTLVFAGGLCTIDLVAITTSAEMLDWIFLINRKPWATVMALQDLVNAFDEIFDPGLNLCPDGRDLHLAKDFWPSEEDDDVSALG